MNAHETEKSLAVLLRVLPQGRMREGDYCKARTALLCESESRLPHVRAGDGRGRATATNRGAYHGALRCGAGARERVGAQLPRVHSGGDHPTPKARQRLTA